MPKEILLYGAVNDYSAETFINSINQAQEDDQEEIVVRVNTNGGSPESLFGMMAKFQEFEGNKIVKVDGKALSAGFFALIYAADSQALDVSSFLVHRAAYPDWYEANYMTESQKENLIAVNKDLRSALEKKIDVAAFEKITKTTMDEVFSMDDRKDVWINAKQAKKIGLINRVVKLEPKKVAEFNANFARVAASFETSVDLLEEISDIGTEEVIETETIDTKMDINELKIKHPEVYKEAVAEGVAQEKIRASSWAAIASVDAEAAQAGIEGEGELTPKATMEIMEKAVKAKADSEAADADKDDNPGDVTPPASETKVEEEKGEEHSEAVKAIMSESKYFNTEKS